MCKVQVSLVLSIVAYAICYLLIAQSFAMFAKSKDACACLALVCINFSILIPSSFLCPISHR